MMTASIGKSNQIEVLTKDNYDTWCIQAEALLIKNDGWEYANGQKQRPAEIEAARAWDVADQKAKSDIILAISAKELKQIKGCKTAHEVWEKLQSIYASKGPAKKAALLKKLTSHRMAHGVDMREHINNFIEVVDKLGDMGIEIHKDLQSAMLLNSLPDTYENFRCAMESRDELPDLEMLKIKILEEFETRKQKHSDEPGAMAARQNEQGKGTKGKYNKYENNRYDKNTNNSKFPIKCFHCGKLGHKAINCYARKGATNKPSAGSVQEMFYANHVEKEKACAVTMDSEHNNWCLDSGCTKHLCKDKEKFIELQPSEHKKLSLASHMSANVEAVTS